MLYSVSLHAMMCVCPSSRKPLERLHLLGPVLKLRGMYPYRPTHLLLALASSGVLFFISSLYGTQSNPLGCGANWLAEWRVVWRTALLKSTTNRNYWPVSCWTPSFHERCPDWTLRAKELLDGSSPGESRLLGVLRYEAHHH